MPNTIDADGLQVATYSEVYDDLVSGYQSIYGQDINVASNSPDGQVIGIMAQNISDVLQVLNQVYNSFSIDSAFGVVLDARVALNGVTRKAGTYTETYVQVVVSAAVNLTGLDALDIDPNAAVFTVSDSTGNQFYLVDSYSFSAAGVATLKFRAVLIGQVQVTENTITVISTVQANVSSVNNPAFTVTTTGDTTSGSAVVTDIPDTTGMTPGMLITCANFPDGTMVLSVDSATQITADANATGTTGDVAITVHTPPTTEGLPEETDPQLKIRRAKTFTLQTVGPADSIRAALLSDSDIGDALVVENHTNATVNGVPAHSVWVIVTGGDPATIAEIIYAKKSAGCGMHGSETQVISNPPSTFTAKWDYSLTQDLYIRATLVPMIAGEVFDVDADEEALAAALVYKLGDSPNVGDVVLAMQTIEPTAIITNCEVSTDGLVWEQIVSPSTAQHYFTVSSANVELTNA